MEELSAAEHQAQEKLAQTVGDAVEGIRGRMRGSQQRVESMGMEPGVEAGSDRVYVPGVGWLVPQTSEHDEDI